MTTLARKVSAKRRHYKKSIDVFSKARKVTDKNNHTFLAKRIYGSVTEALGAAPLTSGFVKGNRCDLPPVGSKNLLEPQLDQRAARKLIKVFGQKSEDFSQDSRRPPRGLN